MNSGSVGAEKEIQVNKDYTNSWYQKSLLGCEMTKCSILARKCYRQEGVTGAHGKIAIRDDKT